MVESRKGNAFRMKPLLLTIPATAKLLGVSRSFLYELMRSGRCPLTPVKFNSRVLFRMEDIENWVAQGCPAKWGKIDE